MKESLVYYCTFWFYIKHLFRFITEILWFLIILACPPPHLPNLEGTEDWNMCSFMNFSGRRRKISNCDNTWNSPVRCWAESKLEINSVAFIYELPPYILYSGCKVNLKELLFVFLMLLTSDNYCQMQPSFMLMKLYALLSFEAHIKIRPFWAEGWR